MYPGEVARWWLETIARHRVRPSSFGRYVDRVRRIESTLGDLNAIALTATRAATWQAELLSSGLASKTVADVRVTLRQVLSAGVDFGLLTINAVDRVPAPKAITKAARALSPDDARALIAASRQDRLGAAVALLFVQGWRISEVLGLSWADVDFAAGTAVVRRAAVYVDGVRMVLGPPRTAGVRGVDFLAPGVVASLRARETDQARERQTAKTWASQHYDGEEVHLAFTTRTGGIVVRALRSESGARPGWGRYPHRPPHGRHDALRRRRHRPRGRRTPRRPRVARDHGRLRARPWDSPAANCGSQLANVMRWWSWLFLVSAARCSMRAARCWVRLERRASISLARRCRSGWSMRPAW